MIRLVCFASLLSQFVNARRGVVRAVCYCEKKNDLCDVRFVRRKRSRSCTCSGVIPVSLLKTDIFVSIYFFNFVGNLCVRRQSSLDEDDLESFCIGFSPLLSSAGWL